MNVVQFKDMVTPPPKRFTLLEKGKPQPPGTKLIEGWPGVMIVEGKSTAVCAYRAT